MTHEHKHCPVCHTPGIQWGGWWYCPRHHQTVVPVHRDGVEISWEEVYSPGEGVYWIVGWGEPQPVPPWEEGGEYGCV
jgi:hypothetical protein